ncbi:MAG: N-acetyltransferase [Acidimicrobiia bacterium]|nr:N-acetyltransferase [Acidimicrobiia bacterium]
MVRTPARSPVRPAPGYVAHESSYVDEGSRIGQGTRIWHFCHVMAGATIGRDCNLGQNVLVAADAVIGDRVKIQNNVSVYGGVVLEDEVFVGPSVVFTNVATPRSAVSRRDAYVQTRVGTGATLGANCTIVCGTTLGRYAFVGAGAVVTKDVPDYGLVIGNPARLRGWMCACGVKLASGATATAPAEAICPACGARYRRAGAALAPLG